MQLKLSKSQKKILESHRSPITRRDLLGISLKATAAFAVTRPFLERVAYGSFADSDLPAFMTIDLAGGAGLAGNFVIGGKNGHADLLPSYNTLGFNPATDKLDNRFGIVSPSDKSKIFQGIIEKLSVEAQALTRISSIAHLSIDDGDNNFTSALGLVARYLELNGKFKQKGLGSLGTESGGVTRLSYNLAQVRPEQLSNLDQLKTLSGFYALEQGGIKENNLKQFIAAQKNEYVNQFRQLTSQDQAALMQSYEFNMDTYFGALTTVELDPRKIPASAATFGLTANTLATDPAALAAGIASCCLMGVVGPSCLTLGGFDYHDGTQTTGDRQDLLAGQRIGSIIELAHRLRRALFIQVVSDGSVVAREGSRNWIADSGSRSVSLMISYQPTGAVRQEKVQIGQFSSAQVADVSTFVGNSTRTVAMVTFLNYLSSIGREADVYKLFSEGELPTSELIACTSFTA